jgi:hypothetical protein
MGYAVDSWRDDGVKNISCDELTDSMYALVSSMFPSLTVVFNCENPSPCTDITVYAFTGPQEGEMVVIFGTEACTMPKKRRKSIPSVITACL